MAAGRVPRNQRRATAPFPAPPGLGYETPHDHTMQWRRRQPRTQREKTGHYVETRPRRVSQQSWKGRERTTSRCGLIAHHMQARSVWPAQQHATAPQNERFARLPQLRLYAAHGHVGSLAWFQEANEREGAVVRVGVCCGATRDLHLIITNVQNCHAVARQGNRHPNRAKSRLVWFLRISRSNFRLIPHHTVAQASTQLVCRIFCVG